MINRIYILSSLLILATLTSCTKPNEERLRHSWRVDSIKLKGELLQQKAAKLYTLKFGEDGRYSLSLDVNSCGGEYSTSAGKVIILDQPGCTRRCCDSEFAEQLSTLLYEMETYHIIGTTLTMKGEEEKIRLSRL